jgi:very-short-patch-repair endonuclease
MDIYDQARVFPQRLRGDAPSRPGTDLRAAGVTRAALSWRTSRGRLARPHRGIYRSHAGAPDLLDRIRDALLVAPAEAVVGFHTAAALHGFGVVTSRTVHLMVPAGAPFPQRPGITVHQVAVPIGDPQLILGVPCAPAERCAVDLARTVRRADAITVLDAAVRTGTCPVDSLQREVARHSGLRGVRHVRELVTLADPRAECRQESQLRLILHDARLRVFEPQVEVCGGDGMPRYRIDLADRQRRVGVEYDGTSHLDRIRLRTDRNRHNWLASRGWTMRYFTDHDLYHRPDRIVAVVRETVRTCPPRRSRANTRG